MTDERQFEQLTPDLEFARLLSDVHERTESLVLTHFTDDERERFRQEAELARLDLEIDQEGVTQAAANTAIRSAMARSIIEDGGDPFDYLDDMPEFTPSEVEDIMKRLAGDKFTQRKILFQSLKLKADAFVSRSLNGHSIGLDDTGYYLESERDMQVDSTPDDEIILSFNYTRIRLRSGVVVQEHYVDTSDQNLGIYERRQMQQEAVEQETAEGLNGLPLDEPMKALLIADLKNLQEALVELNGIQDPQELENALLDALEAQAD